VSQYNNLKAKRTEQQSTIEVINGLKDKVLSVKDDMAFSVKTFQKQMDAINNQINIDKKNQEDAIQLTSSWIDVFLNWVIAIITLLCIVFLVRRFAGSIPTIEKLKSEAALLRARAELSRAKAGAPTPPSFLSNIFGTPAASTAASK
jgi:predicted PurR-regulated permease PerM